MGREESQTIVPNYDTNDELQALMESGEEYILVDVRSESELESGYIPGAINISYESILDLEAEEEDLIILYCRSGNRAGQALDTLYAAGFTNVHNFGGFSKWEGPVVYPE